MQSGAPAARSANRRVLRADRCESWVLVRLLLQAFTERLVEIGPPRREADAVRTELTGRTASACA